MTFWVRPFGDADLVACLAITTAVDPAHPIPLSEARREYDTWNVKRYHRSRYVAEELGGRVVGWGEFIHTPWQFHPDRYRLWLEVDPLDRSRGVGGLLLERVLAELRPFQATVPRPCTGRHRRAMAARRSRQDFLAHGDALDKIQIDVVTETRLIPHRDSSLGSDLDRGMV